MAVSRALAALILGGCGTLADPETVTITPTVKPCDWEVKCHVYVWQVGLRRYGVFVGGTHVNCHCEDKHPS